MFKFVFSFNINLHFNNESIIDVILYIIHNKLLLQIRKSDIAYDRYVKAPYCTHCN